MRVLFYIRRYGELLEFGMQRCMSEKIKVKATSRQVISGKCDALDARINTHTHFRTEAEAVAVQSGSR